MKVNLNKYEILLVEEDMCEAELVKRALSKDNLANNIIHIKHGSKALDFLFCKGEYAYRRNNNSIKVILLGNKLSKIDGLEVLKFIKEDNRTKNIPVVILTSSREEPGIELAYKLGANSYIVKPNNFHIQLNAW